MERHLVDEPWKPVRVSWRALDHSCQVFLDLGAQRGEVAVEVDQVELGNDAPRGREAPGAASVLERLAFGLRIGARLQAASVAGMPCH